ncbi:uncharacterized protein LOC116348960 [Contarinia nasturtii]|uniref:uncharacterized protein LOC116348960 n=1 Tax=Contarinia nasturtii TaxID=265458 RepID=UPI0012D3B1EE|nr:uncharacterized protein LOC116348960 [Contarinia nasturtii]
MIQILSIFGEEAPANNNGKRLLDFCQSSGLIISNTFFKHKKIHTYSWENPGQNQKSLLDYVIVEECLRKSSNHSNRKRKMAQFYSQIIKEFLFIWNLDVERFTMLLTLEQKIQIVSLARQYSYRQTAEIFNYLNPNRLPPLNFRTVYQLFKKLRTLGTLQRKKWSPSAQSITEKRQFEQQIRQLFRANPHMTTRRAAALVGKSQCTVWSALKRMKFWAYKKGKHQKLEPGDPALRKKFCEDLLLMCHLEPGFHKRILWSDEKNFPVNGSFNRQNFRYWAEENPRWIGIVNEVAPEKVIVWTGIIDKTIIGPYFFDGNVNGDSYLEMLTDYLLPTLHANGFNSADICYMHDGAPPHFAGLVRQCLDDNLQFWIGRGEGENRLLPWPPRSPDLNMLDFFLWGTLQHRVYLIENESIEDVANTIINEINDIPAEFLSNTQNNLIKRLYACIEVNGNLFEHLLKYMF